MFNSRQSKKGQITPAMFTSIVSIVVLLIAVGIIISVSFKTQSNLQDVAQDDTATTPNNVSVTFANNTGFFLGNQRIVSGSVVAWNATAGKNPVKLLSGNYTVDYEGGSITFLNSSTTTFNDSVGGINVTYGYKIGSLERNLTTQSKAGLKVISDFQPTFGTLIAVFVVITILVGLGTVIYGKMH